MKTKMTTTAGKTAKVFAAIFIACGLMFTSCKKGDTGPKGDTGSAGTNGAANIQNYQVSVNSTDWSWDALYKEWYYNYPSTASSQSAIMAYVISGNGEEVLPYYSQIYGTTTSFSSYLFSSPSKIMFKYYDGTTTLARPSTSMSIRLVIIPPAMIKPNVNVKNYAEVKAAYNLQD